MESCKAVGSVVANTFFNHDEDSLVSYYGFGTCPNEDITVKGFSQIDHCLVGKSMMDKIVDIWCDRRPCLQSRHFLMQVIANIGFDRKPLLEKPKKYCFAATHNKSNVHQSYCARFCQEVPKVTTSTTLNHHADIISEAMHVAAKQCYSMGRQTRKPWVSQEILEMILLRQEARKWNNYDQEKILHKQIRNSVKAGRKQWLDAQLVGGGWKEIKALKKCPTKKPLQVRGGDNTLVSSGARADTLADYFENVRKANHFGSS